MDMMPVGWELMLVQHNDDWSNRIEVIGSDSNCKTVDKIIITNPNKI